MEMRRVQGIGVVSSVAFAGPILNQFAAGLRMAGVTPKVHDRLGYKSKLLADAVQDFDNDATVGLIVTCDGLPTWAAWMLNASNQDFISLIGGLPGNCPSPPSGRFLGAVNLESYVENSNRISHLGSKAAPNFRPSEIALLYNPNAAMAGTETAAWAQLGAGRAMPGGIDANGNNDETTFGATFSSITERAVVISADPFFHHKREELIGAANSSHKYLCYPSQTFANQGGTQPVHGTATFHGPDLHGFNRSRPLFCFGSDGGGGARRSDPVSGTCSGAAGHK